MPMTLNDEQDLLKDTATDCTNNMLLQRRKLHGEDSAGGLNRLTSELGWAGIPFTEADGIPAFSYRGLAVTEKTRRTLAASPLYAAVRLDYTIADVGTDAQDAQKEQAWPTPPACCNPAVLGYVQELWLRSCCRGAISPPRPANCSEGHRVEYPVEQPAAPATERCRRSWHQVSSKSSSS